MAVLLAAAGTEPDLLIRPCAPLSEAALLAVKEHALAAHREHAGTELPEASVRVRVVGGPPPVHGAPVDAFASRLTLPVQIGGVHVGVVLMESAAQEAFGEGDARVLDVLVNELAQSLGAFAARVAAERERLERVVECMADGLLYAPTGADEVLANPAARRMLGAPAEGPLQNRLAQGGARVLPVRPRARAPGGSFGARLDRRGGPHRRADAVVESSRRSSSAAGGSPASRSRCATSPSRRSSSSARRSSSRW